MKFWRRKKEEVKEEDAKVPNYNTRKHKMFETAPYVKPLDEFSHNAAVVHYYRLHAKTHGLHMSGDLAQSMYATQRHVIQETMEYAERLPKKEK